MVSLSSIFFFYLFSLKCLVIICSGFDEGSPDGKDPLQIARAMASRGITLASFRAVKSLLVQDLLIILLVLCGLRACSKWLLSKSLIRFECNNWVSWFSPL